jgi:hypothetical protein
MHLKVFVKLKKTLKTLSSGQKNPKKTKKPQKTKKPKKTRWAGLKKKKTGFFQPWFDEKPVIKYNFKRILTGIRTELQGIVNKWFSDFTGI